MTTTPTSVPLIIKDALADGPQPAFRERLFRPIPQAVSNATVLGDTVGVGVATTTTTTDAPTHATVGN